MNRQQLEHAIRAAASIAETDTIIIIGSQALLGSYPEAPEILVSSMEVDAFPAGAPDRSDIIDGCIGELSPFHETYGYYVHGIGPESAILPAQWQSRLVPVNTPATRGYTGLCLSPADLAVSKLLAGREKDLRFVKGMLSNKMVSLDDITVLASELDESMQLRLDGAIRLL